MSKFLSEKLGVAAEIIPGFAFKSEEFGKTGTIAVKIKDINPPIINAAEADRVNVSNYSRERLKKYEIHEGDFVVAMTGATVGKIGKHVSKEVLYTNQRVAKIVPRSGFYKEFVYYAIQGGDFLKFILNRLDSSSAQGNISGTSIGEYPIPCPDFQTQRGVAAVLSALDSKIELNNRINAELEGMAKLLYDYWFVQFDFPMTTAQAAALGKPHLTGHPYRASGGKMIYNETLKREIPEGWESGNIFAVSDIGGGATPSKKALEFWGGDVPFFTPTDAKSEPFCIDTEDHLSHLGLKNKATRLYPKGTLFITARGSVGKAMIISREMAMNQSCYALCPHEGVGSAFLYFHTLSLMNHLRVKSSGSVFDSIVTNDLNFTPAVVPDRAQLEAFNKIAEPMFKTILNHQQQNQELTQLRDWLLPMLMNGQVTVGANER